MKFYGIDSVNPLQLGTPSNDNSLSKILVWDPTSQQIKYRDSSSISGGGGSQNLSQVLDNGNSAGTNSINFIDDNSKIFGIVAGTSFFGWTATMSSILAFSSSAFAFRPDTTQQLSGLSVLNSIIGGAEYFYPGSGRSQHAWLMTKGSNDNITSKTELCTNILSQCVCDSLNNCLSYLTLQSSTVNLYSCQGGSNYSLQYMTPTYICKMTSLGTTTSIFSLGTCNQYIRIFTNDLAFTNEIVINPDMVQLNGVAGADGQVFSVNSTGQICWKTVSGGGGSGSVELPTGEVGFGSGTGITSSINFIYDNTRCTINVSPASCIDASSDKSSIIGGEQHCICNNSFDSSIIGGYLNKINTYSSKSSILGGSHNYIHDSSINTSIIGGCYNEIQNNSFDSAILGGCNNGFYSSSCKSTISGGCYNRMTKSCYSGIVSGLGNNMYYSLSSNILGGNTNCIYTSNRSAIIGGETNCICSGSNNSIILGGLNLSLSGESNIVYVPELKVATASNDNTLTKFLVWDEASTKKMLWRDASTICGSIPICNTYVGVGSGSNIVGSAYFTFNSTTHELKVSCSSNLASNQSAIIGGDSHDIAGDSIRSIILGGRVNYIRCASSDSSVISGCCNTVQLYSCMNSILGGFHNTISCCVSKSVILGGNCNYFCAQYGKGITSSAIIGGYCNAFAYVKANSLADRSVIIGGCQNKIFDDAINSAIIGGGTNCLQSSSNSAIIGGSGYCICNCDNLVVVPSIKTAYPVGTCNVSPPVLGNHLRFGDVVTSIGGSLADDCWLTINVGGSYFKLALLR